MRTKKGRRDARKRKAPPETVQASNITATSKSNEGGGKKRRTNWNKDPRMKIDNIGARRQICCKGGGGCDGEREGEGCIRGGGGN